MPAQPDLAGILFTGAVLVLLVALIYCMHRRGGMDPKMSFLLGLIDTTAADLGYIEER
jgi:hypothetical protein